MPSDEQFRQIYQTLAARLKACHEEVARQGRARPMAEVPVETVRLVKRLLSEARRFVGSINRKARLIQPLPQGTLRFSTLALFLGDTVHRFEGFGTALLLDGPAPGTRDANLRKAETDLAAMIAASAQDIRRFREKRDAERAEQRAREAEWDRQRGER